MTILTITTSASDIETLRNHVANGWTWCDDVGAFVDLSSGLAGNGSAWLVPECEEALEEALDCYLSEV
jgi:hypothetical protein